MLVTQEELETHQEHKIIELAAVAEELHKLVLNLQLEKVTWCFQLKHYLNHQFFHLAELEKLQVVAVSYTHLTLPTIYSV